MGTGPYFNFKETSQLNHGAFFVFTDGKEFSTTEHEWQNDTAATTSYSAKTETTIA
jgi:hypothetical protein